MTFFSANLQESGSYGLEGATHSAVKKALTQLGGEYSRTAKKEMNDYMRMPTGFQIAVGRPNSGPNDFKRDGLQQLMEQVIRAGVEPILFLALLDVQGVSWYTKPAIVSNLASYIRKIKPNLSTPKWWRQVLKDFGHSRYDEQAVKAEGLRRATQSDSSHAHRLPEALELAGVPESRQRAVEQWIYESFRKQTGEAYDAVKDKDLLVEESGKRRSYQLTADGVVRLATITQEREIKLGHQQATPEPASVKETTSVVKPEQALTPGQAVVLLAQEHGLDLPWREEDPLTVDHERLLVLLAEKL